MTFTYFVTAADWGRIAPELVLAGFVLLVMIADLLLLPRGKNPKVAGPTNFVALPVLSLLGIAGALLATIILYTSVVDQAHLSAFNSMIGSDFGSLYAYVIILSASGLGLLLSPSYLRRLKLVHQGEYYALYLLATIGMMLMAAATSFLTIFLGLEMLSLALYILCGFVSRRLSSQESSMKYFLLSSFASAFLLYGIALTYGSTGSTTFSAIHAFLAAHSNGTFNAHILMLVAMGLLIVGFAFKVSAIPFQAWTPDVYDGAPAPITAFMSVGTKAAALIAFMRVFDVVLGPVQSDWMPVVWAITILTIIGGNVLALVQTNLKRLLAYSSIAHAGYLLIGIVAGGTGGTVGMAAILFYLFCYTFMNMGAFGIVAVLERPDNSGSNYSDIRGLWYRQPVLAGLLAFFMLALAGFPPMAGFAAKYYLFYAALQSGHPELLIIGVLASVFGMYYYLRIIATMFMEKEAVAVAAATVPATPVPSDGRRISSKLSNKDAMASPAPTRSGSTAVAVKTTTAKQASVGKTTRTKTDVMTVNESVANIGNWSWAALSIATVGTLALGTILAPSFVDMAQRAAQMMMLLR